MKYLKETKAQFDSIDSSRDVYTSIREANRTLRKLKALKQGYSWNEAPTGWLWVKWKLSELLDDIGFELLLGTSDKGKGQQKNKKYWLHAPKIKRNASIFNVESDFLT